MSALLMWLCVCVCCMCVYVCVCGALKVKGCREVGAGRLRRIAVPQPTHPENPQSQPLRNDERGALKVIYMCKVNKVRCMRSGRCGPGPGGQGRDGQSQ